MSCHTILSKVCLKKILCFSLLYNWSQQDVFHILYSGLSNYFLCSHEFFLIRYSSMLVIFSHVNVYCSWNVIAHTENSWILCYVFCILFSLQFQCNRIYNFKLCSAFFISFLNYPSWFAIANNLHSVHLCFLL